MRHTFDRFELDHDRRELLDGGRAVHLSPKAFLLLQLLADAAPRALSKQELTDAIWPDTFVEECNLPGLIVEVRDALGDEARQPRFIRTLHGFGYAFCADVTRAGGRERRGCVIVRGREFALYDGDNVIGREVSATVSVDDPTVSRRHACIHIHDGVATVSDLGSKNGTFVGNTKIASRVVLSEGDTIVLGDVRLTFSTALATPSTLTLQRV